MSTGDSVFPLVDSRDESRRLWTAALVFALLGWAALPIDLAASSFANSANFPGHKEVRKLFNLSEVFSHGTGVGLVCLTVLVLDRHRRWAVPRVAACAYGSGLVANLIKLAVPRIRPRNFPHLDPALPGYTQSIWDSFVGGIPITDPATFPSSEIQSFPSAHTATVVGLMIALSRLYPHGAKWFAALACFAALQRLEARAHWVSDVCCGAAVGCAWSAIHFGRNFISGWFNHYEETASRLAAKRRHGSAAPRK